ncbi:hypothetical protein SAMN05192555_101212 [Franzmannia pantelleriensis]|uniref:Glycosyl transferase family 2 n=1 Tax=Franzmannia pantelleriensis TaxID=48727 RepID=A0A1G9ESB4_9GAMM|nr:hypothetical protein [Halomonas pantelleriensis]SDK79082.1 hypothetical protein SAMN05192555_101212 [Halomonas pantelleriensis]
MLRKYLVWLNSRRYQLSGFLIKNWVFFRFFFTPKNRNKESGVVISLTSYPERISVVHYVIKSLIVGSDIPEKIVLWLGQDEMKGVSIPKSLSVLDKCTAIFEIRYVPRGLKSYDKLVHALDAFPDYIIVTVDDDTLYPRYFLKDFLAKHRENQRSVVCYRGVNLEKNSSRGFKPYNEMLSASRSFESKGESWSLMPTGCSGVLYPPGSLSELASSYELIRKYALHADDIWFKACALSADTPAILVRNKCIRFPSIGNNKEALYFENVVNGGNDKALKLVFDNFNLWGRLD